VVEDSYAKYRSLFRYNIAKLRRNLGIVNFNPDRLSIAKEKRQGRGKPDQHPWMSRLASSGAALQTRKEQAMGQRQRGKTYSRIPDSHEILRREIFVDRSQGLCSTDLPREHG